MILDSEHAHAVLYLGNGQVESANPLVCSAAELQSKRGAEVSALIVGDGGL